MCRSSVTARSPSRKERSRPARVSSSSCHAAVDSCTVSLICADSSRDESGGAVYPRIVEYVPTGEQRQERGAGNELDEFGRGDVRPYLAARDGLRQAIRQTAGQDVAEALQQGGV